MRLSREVSVLLGRSRVVTTGSVLMVNNRVSRWEFRILVSQELCYERVSGSVDHLVVDTTEHVVPGF